MSWTAPDDIKKSALKHWAKGSILRHLACSNDDLFPIKFTLRKPKASEISENFTSVRDWSLRLCNIPNVRVEMKEINHRLFGRNEYPMALWIDDLDSIVKLLGKQSEVRTFRTLVSKVADRCPEVAPWLAKRPMKALDLEGAWTRLIDVVMWLQANPMPGIYLRQVSLPGIDSKFIEKHRGVLSELLELVLRTEDINAEAIGAANFCKRFGFLDKPLLVRFRILDRSLSRFGTSSVEDTTLDCATFDLLNPEVTNVFFTENEINFLAFPEVPRSMVVFGAGYGFDAFKKNQWLRTKKIYYWGDIDTHGFAILSQLRGQFPDVQSFLMDRDTLMDFESFWGIEETPSKRDLPNLSAAEYSLYNELRDNCIRKNLRLEQERIVFLRVEESLSQLSESY
tara:strand:+ start:5871 stop:7058 length:1188 start_codon:yes stop_codon:yes gene_type:complete